MNKRKSVSKERWLKAKSELRSSFSPPVIAIIPEYEIPKQDPLVLNCQNNLKRIIKKRHKMMI